MTAKKSKEVELEVEAAEVAEVKEVAEEVLPPEPEPEPEPKAAVPASQPAPRIKTGRRRVSR